MSVDQTTRKAKGKFQLTMRMMLVIAIGVGIAMLVLEIVTRHGNGVFLIALASTIVIVVIQACALGATLSRRATAALIVVSIVVLVVFLVFATLFSLPVVHYWRDDLGTLGKVAAWTLVAAPTGIISGVVFGGLIGLIQMPALARKKGWWILASIIGGLLDGLIVGTLFWAAYSTGLPRGGPPSRFGDLAQALIIILALVPATGVFRGILTTLVLVRAQKGEAEIALTAMEH